MLNRLLICTSLVAVGTTSAYAQGFSGGSLGVDYTTLADVDEFDKLVLRGAAEYALTPDFALALDVVFYDYSDLPDEIGLTNYTLHGIYQLNDAVALAGWIGQDRISSSGGDQMIDNYGVEVAYVAGPAAMQGYLGRGSAEQGIDLTYFGLSGDYGYGNGFAVIGAYNLVDVADDDFSFQTVELGGSYEVTAGASFFATVGNFNIQLGSNSTDETFYTVGATFNFGPETGTTFNQRGYLDLPLPF